MHQALDVPVGLIAPRGAARRGVVGGVDAMEKVADLSPLLERARGANDNYPARLAAWTGVAEKAGAGASPPPQAGASDNDPNRAASLYNGMIAPIVPIASAARSGTRLEQRRRAEQYRKLLPTMIQSLRSPGTRTGAAREFPFLIVSAG